MDDIVARFVSPDSLSVILYVAGVYCIATAFGIATGVQVGKLSLPSPVSRTAKTLMIAVGISLVSLGLFRSLQYPEYKPVVFERWVYQGDNVKQIVADGETVYLLKENGDIYTISQGEVSLIPREEEASSVDPDLIAKQIMPAGGALYILKGNGNIWVYQPNFEELPFKPPSS